MKVDWVSGACMVVRGEAVRDVGFMDERFFLYWEDADWCRRMLQKGWQVVYFPGATAYHRVGGSSQKNILRSVFEFHKSSYRLFAKYAKGLPRFVKPLVILGLSLRLFNVYVFHGVRRLLDQVLRRGRGTHLTSDERSLSYAAPLLEEKDLPDRRSEVDRRNGLDRRGLRDRRKLKDGPKTIEMRRGKDRRNDSDRRRGIERRTAFAR
jgi:GT2 family glycosyltransferase